MNLYLLLPLILAVFAFGNLSSSFAEIESIDVVENKLVTLIGEGFDSDTRDLSFKWTQIYGEPVKLSSTTEPEPTFMAPNVKNGEIKVLTFELRVFDDNERESMDTVVITVDPVNSPPEASASAKQ
ncbi:MAG: hypothetical protein ISR81_02170 [Nitrosopumilus sp.]|nr:hypothetical protein [Nitrosopumilus sp.]